MAAPPEAQQHQAQKSTRAVAWARPQEIVAEPCQELEVSLYDEAWGEVPRIREEQDTGNTHSATASTLPNCTCSSAMSPAPLEVPAFPSTQSTCRSELIHHDPSLKSEVEVTLRSASEH